MRALPLTARPASADGLADSHRTGCLSQFCASKGIGHNYVAYRQRRQTMAGAITGMDTVW